MRTALLRIDSAAESGYPVKLFVDDGAGGWLQEPRAQAAIPIDLPVPPHIPGLDLERGTLEGIRSLVLSEDERSTAFQEVGAFLHSLLARGNVGEAWAALATADPDEGLRVLFDVRDRELRRLPWELMRRNSPLPLFADLSNPCARAYGLADPPHVECSPHLRVLVVVGARDDDRAVEAELELDRLRDALRTRWGLTDLEILIRPTQQKLEATYLDRRPHILHFIGHGRVSGDSGGLIIEGEGGEAAWSWNATAIAVVLGGWKPRLAFINSCRSAMENDQASSKVANAWQIADALLNAGVPAVLTMQGDIGGSAAAEFTGAFYTAIAAERPLDVAVVEGRIAISYGADWTRRDPWLPCLWLSVPPDRVLPPRYGVTPRQLALIERTPVFAPMKRFVNRTAERRALWRRLSDGGATPALGSVLAVVGGDDVGKSELVKWALGSAALRGANVAYVDLRQEGNPEGTLDFVGALMAISSELGDSAVHGDINKETFEAFRAAAHYFRATKENSAEDAIDTVFAAFAEALRVASGCGSVTFALDHLSHIDPGSWEIICDKLLAPVAAGTLPGRVVVAHSSLEDLKLGRLAAEVECIHLPRLNARDYRELAGRYLRAQGYIPAQYEPVIDALANDLDMDWDAKMFALLDQVAGTVHWTREPR